MADSNNDEYQGWTNRETWAASLHLSNAEWLYNGARDVVTDALQAAGSDAGPFTAGNALEGWVTDIVDAHHETQDDKTTVGPCRENPDITMMDREVGSWWRVNWREVADGLMDA
jgi:hypothetical protein